MSPSNPTPANRTWALVDLAAVLANARTVAAASGVRLLPMVKADAYGLGAPAVARCLEALDPWGFGVATLEEGEQLRTMGIERPILVFTPLQPAWIDRLLAFRLRPVIGDLEALRAWCAQADGAPYHIEIDTGMSRAGFRWTDQAAIAELPGIYGEAAPEGVFTHFHSADDDPASLEQQWDRFTRVVAGFPVRPDLVHAANSAAALRDTRFAGDMVRPGIFLYGGEAGGRYPRPAVQFQARVVAVRRVEQGEPVSYGATWIAPEACTVASLAIGYADGMPRTLSAPQGRVELNQHLVPVAGRVTMDMTMVAVPPEVPVAVGDVATIFGGRISLDQQAAAAGTISYELLTGMSRRVPRRYQAAEEAV